MIRKSFFLILLPMFLLALLFGIYSQFFKINDEKSLIVYSSHDMIFAKKIFNLFEQKTGIKIIAVSDTEATKSLGLIELIVKEKDSPRCDVFWNNELLGILDLKKKGLLESYKGSGYRRIPEKYKDTDGYWTGFAARLRVYIINKQFMQTSYKEIQEKMNSNLEYFAFAKPLFGTTLTHYSVLWDVMGEKALKQFHKDNLKKGMKIVTGNGEVKRLVSHGYCHFGLTDTDDFFDAFDSGKKVDFLPYKLKNGQTIVIPNTVAIIKGTKKRKLAEQFIDFLLSEEAEIALANSGSRQVPLGKVNQKKLPKEIKKLLPQILKGYPLNGLLESRNKTLKWLKKVYFK